MTKVTKKKETKTENKKIENNIKSKIIILAAILITIMISLLIFSLPQIKEKNYKMYKKDKEIINNKKEKKDMLIYLYSNDEEKCMFCKEINKTVKNYDKYYKLNIIYYNKDNADEKKYKELEKITGLDQINMTLPTLIYFKDDNVTTVNNIFAEAVIYEFLTTNKIIEENKYNNLIVTAKKIWGSI